MGPNTRSLTRIAALSDGLASVTMLFVVVAWLNEICGVRKLKAERAHVRAMLQEGQR